MDSNPQDLAQGDQRAPRPSLRAPWSEFREALDAAGFHPSRRLGQNFLLDDNMARAIAQDAGVEPGRFVLEVGPGCGFLSVHLADRGARLLCSEVDLSTIECEVTYVAVREDRLVPIEQIRSAADQTPKARFLELSSYYGHDAFLKEVDAISSILAAFTGAGR